MTGKWKPFFNRCVSFIEASHKHLYLRHLPTWFQTPQLRLFLLPGRSYLSLAGQNNYDTSDLYLWVVLVYTVPWNFFLYFCDGAGVVPCSKTISGLRTAFEAGGTVVDIGCGVGWSRYFRKKILLQNRNIWEFSEKYYFNFAYKDDRFLKPKIFSNWINTFYIRVCSKKSEILLCFKLLTKTLLATLTMQFNNVNVPGPVFSIAISSTFPQLKVLAVDCDSESIRQANINIKVTPSVADPIDFCSDPEPT